MDRLNWRKLLLLALPVIFMLSLAVTLAACMAQSGSGLGDSPVRTPDVGTVHVNTGITTKKTENTESPESSGLSFRSNGDGTCSVTGIGTYAGGYVNVPQKSADGDLVVAIADSAFFGVSGITGITLPTGITEIGSYAFYGSGITGIIIPAKVEKIGECAFSDCRSLAAITVVSGNQSYCAQDGVLFTKDKSTLCCYPSGKQNTEYTIRTGIIEISNAAFYNCTGLKAVSYNGKEAEWKSIRIGSGNDYLLSLPLSYAKTATK